MLNKLSSGEGNDGSVAGCGVRSLRREAKASGSVTQFSWKLETSYILVVLGIKNCNYFSLDSETLSEDIFILSTIVWRRADACFDIESRASSLYCVGM